MNKGKKFGVWVSVALVLFVACCSVGYYVGASVAVWRVRRLELYHSPEVARLNAKLDVLSKIQVARILKDVPSECSSDPDSGLALALRRMSEFEADASMKQVIEYELGIALINAAEHAERAANERLAGERFREAQSVFAELGWKDTSQNALRSLIERKDEKSSTRTPREACND